ncbi:MAG TPA: thiamine pyrophosphate-requiring protein [Roseiarcus sp.]|nr:thiamine pyrophosphate-requiring protein [Roseiarcus sp.]
MPSASAALLDALTEAGVSCIFANFGSDHPALVEAIAEARAKGRAIPKIITSPHEFVAMSAAHGYAQLTGHAQAVFVHVECGTQTLGGAVHNAARARVPLFVFAGLSPFTQEGELRGARNEFIQWIQDVYDQRGIVREYMKYNNEFRTGRNIKTIVRRAMQFAHSDPQGPVYLTGAREVMEEEVPSLPEEGQYWPAIEPSPLAESAAAELVGALAKAKRPIVVTSYLGRSADAVRSLVRLCERLGIGVLESVPSRMNYPHREAMYQGNHWNHPFQNPALAEADVVLVIDSDVPWIPTINRPRADAAIFHIDIDPLKASTPLWRINARRTFRADAASALLQMNAYLDRAGYDEAAAEARRRFWRDKHERRAAEISREEEAKDETITPEYLTACLRRQVGDEAIVLNEGITNYHVICDHMARNEPHSIFASGGGSLGWNGGAAIGMKLAAPERTIVALTGDGSYMFSVPSTVHWMARRYQAPFLQVVYNNRGWKAPKFSALAVHPDGYASRAADLDLSFEPSPDYAGLAAAAGGAFGLTLRKASDVEPGVKEALRVMREEKRAAVLDVWLPPG